MEKRFEDLTRDGKRPASELTDEEVYYMLEQIVNKEASLRNPDITTKMFGSCKDIVHDIYTYLIGKDFRGKQGLKWLQNNLDVEHFKNSLFVFARNEYNGNIRKKKINHYLFNVDSMDMPVDKNDSSKGFVLDTLVEQVGDTSTLDKIIDDESMLELFNSISDKCEKDYFIKYRNNPIVRLSFRKLAKLMYELYEETQIQISPNSLFDKKPNEGSFEKIPIIYKKDKNTNKLIKVNNGEISKLLSKMRKSLENDSNFRKVAREVV